MKPILELAVAQLQYALTGFCRIVRSPKRRPPMLGQVPLEVIGPTVELQMTDPDKFARYRINTSRASEFPTLLLPVRRWPGSLSRLRTPFALTHESDNR
jgi:hypothetical protein